MKIEYHLAYYLILEEVKSDLLNISNSSNIYILYDLNLLIVFHHLSCPLFPSNIVLSR